MVACPPVTGQFLNLDVCRAPTGQFDWQRELSRPGRGGGSGHEVTRPGEALVRPARDDVPQILNHSPQFMV
jgi:hypothetical protein